MVSENENKPPSDDDKLQLTEIIQWLTRDHSELLDLCRERDNFFQLFDQIVFKRGKDLKSVIQQTNFGDRYKSIIRWKNKTGLPKDWRLSDGIAFIKETHEILNYTQQEVDELQFAFFCQLMFSQEELKASS